MSLTDYLAALKHRRATGTDLNAAERAAYDRAIVNVEKEIAERGCVDSDTHERGPKPPLE